jgi:hypothetical protein
MNIDLQAAAVSYLTTLIMVDATVHEMQSEVYSSEKALMHTLV